MVEHCLAELCMLKTLHAIAKAFGYYLRADSVGEATTYLQHQISNMEKWSWGSTRNFTLTDYDTQC